MAQQGLPQATDPYADLTDVELGKRVKQKYAGAYDDMTDAELGNKVRVKFTPRLGEVSKAAAKRLPEMEAARTAYESEQDTRAIRAQAVREIGAPIAAGAVGLATGGLGLLPAIGAAAGTGAAAEGAAQVAERGADVFNTDVGKAVATAAALEASGELGGRILGMGIQKVLSSRAATRAVGKAAATAEDILAEQINFPRVSGAPKFIQEKINARMVQAISQRGDEILADLGGPLSAELQGGRVKTVFDKIEDVFVQEAKSLRNNLVKNAGDEIIPLKQSATKFADLASELEKRPIGEKAAGVVADHIDKFRNLETLNDAIAFRTDLRSNITRLGHNNPAGDMLKRTYTALSKDITAALAAKDPILAQAFEQSDEMFATFYQGLKNKVIYGLVESARGGDGTAVVKQLMAASPKDTREVFEWVGKTAAKELPEFTETVQRAAAQQLLGVTEAGAPTLGVGLGERLAEFGTDRLNDIFGRTAKGKTMLENIKGLESLVAPYQKNVKIPPQVVESANVRVTNAVTEAVSVGALATFGGPYGQALAAARGGRALAGAAMEAVLSRPELYRQFRNGVSSIYRAAVAPTQKAADLLLKAGTNNVKTAVRVGTREAVRKEGRSPSASR